MELDSGAAVSVLPGYMYKEYFSNIELRETSTRLKTYDGNIIVPLGEIEVMITYRSITKEKCKLIIVEKGTKPLLGRDLMNTFGFTFHSVEVNSVESSELEFLIKRYNKLFNGLGSYKYETIDFSLCNPETKPIFVKPRPVPFAFKKLVDQELDRLEAEGVISLVENAQWGTPLVPVVKPNGGIRLCADYKVTVNRYLEDVKHPLPRIEELFCALQEGEQYTKLDLFNAYNQLMLSDRTKKLLAWSTHRGIYVPNRLPYGTKPAVAIFQKIIEKVLQGLPGVINFLDDIVVTGKTKQEHLKNVESVFQRLSEAGLTLNLSKCSFFQPEIKYLGHIINKEGLHKDRSKIEAMLKVSRPKNILEIKAFVGMLQYYSRFMPRLAIILEPLYKLLRNNVKFQWTKDCEDSFNKAKKLLVSEQSLARFDPDITLKLVCDSSSIGLGSVLMHVFPDGTEKPICFASRILNKAERAYSVIHKEALAIFWSVKRFYQYLMGNEFILCSDHKPLLALFGENKGIPQMAAGRLQRWALFLSGFKYKFQHISGKANEVADCLSRLPVKDVTSEDSVQFDYFHFLIEDKIPITSYQIRDELRRDPILSKVYLYVRDGFPDACSDEFKPFHRRANELSIDNGLLMWGFRVIIPKKFRSQLLVEIHGAHMGAAKMKSLARQYFWWPCLDQDIEHFVKACVACMENSRNPNRASLIKYEQAKGPFDRIHIDYAGPFFGKNFLVVIDSYTKWPEVYEMTKTDSFHTIEKLRDCFSRFGLANCIVSDNGTQFVSSEFAEFCRYNNIKHVKTAPYHPASNGAAENMVKTFKTSLKKYISENQHKFSFGNLLSKFLFSYRNTPHCSTGECPSKLMFNRKVKTRLDFLVSPVAQKAISDQIKYFHGNREISFDIDEIVYVKDYRYHRNAVWTKAKIIRKLSDRSYICKILDSNLEWKRHVDQIVKIGEFYSNFDGQNEDEGNRNIDGNSSIDQNISEKPILIIPHKEFESQKEQEITGSAPIDPIVNTPAITNNSVREPDLPSRECSNNRENVVFVPNVITRPRRQIKAPDRLNL